MVPSKNYEGTKVVRVHLAIESLLDSSVVHEDEVTRFVSVID
jgi:hypothetical protein